MVAVTSSKPRNFHKVVWKVQGTRFERTYCKCIFVRRHGEVLQLQKGFGFSFQLIQIRWCPGPVAVAAGAGILQMDHQKRMPMPIPIMSICPSTTTTLTTELIQNSSLLSIISWPGLNLFFLPSMFPAVSAAALFLLFYFISLLRYYIYL